MYGETKAVRNLLPAYLRPSESRDMLDRIKGEKELISCEQ